MRILIAAPYYAPRPGGLENYAHGVATALRQAGHEVLVVASRHNDGPAETIIDGVRVQRWRPWLKVSNTPVNPWWYIKLRRTIRQFAPDVVMAHTPVPFMADIAARASGRRPFVLVYHNDLAKDAWLPRLIVGAYWRLLGRGTLRRADRIIATSQFYAERSSFLAPYHAKTAIVAPGIDPARFRADLDRGWLKTSGRDGRVISFVASLDLTHAHKGLGILLEAIADVRRDMPDVRLVVGGQGDGLASYRAKAARLGIADAVEFLGYVADDDLPKLYAGSDVFVLPSTNEAEGFGMVLLEAAACGTPVIGTKVGGIPAALAAAGSSHACAPTATGVAGAIRRVLAAPSHAAPAVVTTWRDAAADTLAVLERARQPRVLLLHNVIPPYRLDVFDELAQSCQLSVVFAQAQTSDRQWAYNLARRRFAYRVLRGRTLGPVALNLNALSVVWRNRFEVLITNTDIDTAPLTLAAVVVAKLRRARVVVWSEVTDPRVQSLPAWSYGRGWRRRVAAVIGRAIVAYRQIVFAAADEAVAFSAAAETFVRRYGFTRTLCRSAQVMPPSQLAALPIDSRDAHATTFLYIGYLNRRKNVSLLIAAFGQVADPAARLVIAGSGPDEVALRAQAAGDARIRFTGFVDGEAKAKLYAAAHVLVLPTLSDCWGLVVNEAMHYGLAVIVSDAAASSELVDETAGIVFASGDERMLAAALNRLASDPYTRDAMGRHNRGRTDVTDIAAAAAGLRQAVTAEVAQ